MKKNNIIKTGASVIAIAGILMSQLMPSAETVIKNGDLSVEKWISSGENLNMNNYVQGVDTFENALSDLKRKNTDYKRADDPEYDAICEFVLRGKNSRAAFEGAEAYFGFFFEFHLRRLFKRRRILY